MDWALEELVNHLCALRFESAILLSDRKMFKGLRQYLLAERRRLRLEGRALVCSVPASRFANACNSEEFVDKNGVARQCLRCHKLRPIDARDGWRDVPHWLLPSWRCPDSARILSTLQARC